MITTFRGKIHQGYQGALTRRAHGVLQAGDAGAAGVNCLFTLTPGSGPRSVDVNQDVKRLDSLLQNIIVIKCKRDGGYGLATLKNCSTSLVNSYLAKPRI